MNTKSLTSSFTPSSERVPRLTSLSAALAVVILSLLAGTPARTYAQQGQTVQARAVPEATPRAPQTYTREGVSIEFAVEPVSHGEGKPGQLLAGTEATISFRIFDANAGNPINNLRPAAWISRREAGEATGDRACREKIQAFLQTDFTKRPTIDLNTYFVLALNHEPNISVIDPLSGFGGSKLYTLIPLRATGEDWVMSADKKRLYVSMPSVNQVAVVDTVTWKSVADIDAGLSPTRVALQHDGRYLWVGNDGEGEKGGGITVIDTSTLKVAAQLKTGAGHHEIAFNEDDSLAFVTNKLEGTLSVIDVRKLSKVADVKVGSLPSALAFSPLSRSVYVASEGDGTIVVVDGSRREILTRIKARPGLKTIRLLPEGRFGFAVNQKTGTVFIFDVSSNRLVHEVPVGGAADQVAFTQQFAYVRSSGNEFVTMIKLSGLGKEAPITRFQAGQKAPRESPANSLADAIVPAPEGSSVLVANPADKMIYFYTEGMAAPMGSFQNYRRDPKALLVLDNSLRESARGVYTTNIRLAGPGRYDVAFLLDSPRVVNCFDLNIDDNPDMPRQAGVAIRVEPVGKEPTARVGETYTLRFRVNDAQTKQAKANLEDVGTLVFLAPGIWQQRDWARHVGEGVYEISFVPPRPGVYYIYFHSPSLGVQLNHVTPMTVQALPK
jgi:YVTN family beta-propeller protein